MTKITDLISKKILKIELVEDYVQIFFTQKTLMNIYNNYHFFGALPNDFIGKKIKTINETDRIIIFEFNKGGTLIIGIEDGDYFGPEALEIHIDGKPTLVWN